MNRTPSTITVRKTYRPPPTWLVVGAAFPDRPAYRQQRVSKAPSPQSSLLTSPVRSLGSSGRKEQSSVNGKPKQWPASTEKLKFCTARTLPKLLLRFFTVMTVEPIFDKQLLFEFSCYDPILIRLQYHIYRSNAAIVRIDNLAGALNKM